MGILNCDSDTNGEKNFLNTYLAYAVSPVVFDVGANVGDYSQMVKSACISSVIYAFEPHPLTFAKLEERCKSDSDINTFNFGLGKEEGRTSLFDYSADDGSQHASIYKDVIEKIHQGKSLSHEISIRTLDNVISELNIGRIDLLKIDTAGNELRVLQGAEKSIRNGIVNAIHFEFNEMNVISRTFFKDFLDFLPEYDFFRLIPNGFLRINAYVPRLCEIFAYQNIVCIKKATVAPSTKNPVDNKSKLLLISIYIGDGPIFPMGIGYLVSSVKRDRDVKAVHYQNMEYAAQQLPIIMDSFCPDVVGLSCTSFNRGYIKDFCHLIKNKYPSTKIILGGVHVSFLPEQALRYYFADYVVIGEGEETLRELCNHIDNNADIKDIDGVAYLKDNRFVQNKERTPISNLDELPMPDFSFGEDLMLSSGIGFVISSRGCPVRCDFCSTGSYWGQKVRMNSPQRIVDEIELLITKYGIKKLFFHDDTFNISLKRVFDICNEILKRNIKIDWAVSCRVHPVSEEMIDIMVLAGCKHICWGVETGSDIMLSKINKKITKQQIRNAFALCEKHIGVISVGAFMMVGNPGEDEQTIEETITFMNTIKLTDAPSTAVLYILPGTTLYNRLLIDHPELEDFWIQSNSISSYTYDHEHSTLVQWASRISRSGNIVPFDKSKHFWKYT